MKKQRKKREPNKVVTDPGIKCPHCGELYKHRITNTYSNGNRRRICSGCQKPFVSRLAEIKVVS